MLYTKEYVDKLKDKLEDKNAVIAIQGLLLILLSMAIFVLGR